MKKVVLRIDDIGASSKVYEVYSKKWFGFGNFLYLKYLPYFKAWGPYQELSSEDWIEILTVLRKNKAKLTVGITAAWVEYDGTLTPFPEKFPEVIPVLREGIASGLLEIASHGLTHCVLKDKLFRPKPFSSNRTYHREFWDWLPREVHQEHIKRSLSILRESFGEVTTLIPPGNVFSEETVEAARNNGILLINCNSFSRDDGVLRVRGNDNVFAFHDKEIVEYGVSWLEKKIQTFKDTEFILAKDLT